MTAVMLQMTLGRFIRESRKKRGISLRALARLVEIAPQFLSDIERDRTRPSDGVLDRIREELEIASNELDAFDSRVPWADLRELLDESPEFRLVVRDAVRAWRAGQKPQDLAKALRRGIDRAREVSPG